MKNLLWPNGSPSSASDSNWADDLEIDVLVRALDFDGRHARLVRRLLLAPLTDPSTIRYRQAILADLLAAPALQKTLEKLLPALASLGSAGRDALWSSESPLLTVARRLGELDLYVSTVTRLRDVLLSETLHAEGWLDLRAELDEIASDSLFKRLAAELPELKQPLRQLASVTIGVNLDAELQPSGATLLSINDFQFTGRQHDLFSRLFGGNNDESALTPLRPANAEACDPFSVQLRKDLEKIVGDVGQALADSIARYNRITGRSLAPLQEAFAFYLGAAHLIERLEAADLPLATPTMVPVEQRQTRVEGLYDVSLALQLLEQRGKAELVLNDACLDESGRVAILTGPNRGGKTTFTRAVALVHVMAQSGLPVPARHATLSPVDAIFSQFATGESHTVGYGRFDEELRQLAEIFAGATPGSLILLNEPLSGTSPEEALHIARGLVRGFQQLGARTILATHLHTLAREAPAFSQSTPDAPVISLVASPSDSNNGSDEPRRSFRVIQRAPIGESRALEIARQHGLSPEQVTEQLRSRGLLEESGCYNKDSCWTTYSHPTGTGQRISLSAPTCREMGGCLAMPLTVRMST
ncbi:MAG: hypothetical protein M3220_04685 [Chloroflexota bacterium]|nr:hypothetical protein [Chloroflexota bacterium]